MKDEKNENLILSDPSASPTIFKKPEEHQKKNKRIKEIKKTKENKKKNGSQKKTMIITSTV